MAWDELEDLRDDEGPVTVDRLSCEKLRFHSGSPVVQPAGLLVLRDVLRYLKDNDRRLLVTAHTDTVDSDENNQALSDRRARSVLLLLRYERKAWAELCLEHHRPRDVEDVLRWAAVCWLWPCHPDRPGSHPPLEAFKRGVQRKFPSFKETSADVTLAFWEAVFVLYQTYLQKDLLGIKSGKERNAYLEALRWLDPEHPSIGCGERHLRVETGQNVDEPENRRIELLFVRPDQGPAPGESAETVGGHPAALESLYDPAAYRFFELPCPHPSFNDHDLHPGNLVFVLDVSTSMRGTRVETARRRLIGAISALSEDTSFTVVTFGVETESVWWEGPSRTITPRSGSPRQAADFAAGAKPLVKVATEANRLDAIERLAAIPLQPDTSTADALAAALRATGLREVDAEKGERNAIEFLSDGYPSRRSLLNGARVPRGTPRAEQVSLAKECELILAHVRENNPSGFVLNASAFFPRQRQQGERRVEAQVAREVLKFMQELPTLGPVEGVFEDERMGLTNS